MADEEKEKIKIDDKKQGELLDASKAGAAEYASKVKAAEEQIAALTAQLDKLQRDVRRGGDDARIKAGETEKLLAERTAELEKIQADYKSTQKLMQERADRLVEKLDDDGKKRVAKFKDRLSVVDFISLVEDEIERKPSDKEPERKPTPAPTPGGIQTKTMKPNNGKRELDQQTYSIYDKLGLNPASAEGLTVVTDETSGDAKFTKPIRQFFEEMKTTRPRNWSRQEAEKNR